MPINVVAVSYNDFIRSDIPTMILKHNPEIATKIVNIGYAEEEFNFVYAKENYTNAPFVT